MADKKTDLLTGLALLVSVAALSVSLVAVTRIPKTDAAQSNSEQTVQTQQSNDQAGDIQYVLFIGTNDKDSNEPVFESEDCREHLEQILTDHFGGFTIQDARGGWVNDDGSIAHEYTMVVYLSDTDLDAVHSACDDLIQEFNQSAILIQQNSTITEFYSG